MEILVIRHGQSEADIIGCHEGRADFMLTELGLKQASLLSCWIKENYPPDFILSSTLNRASQTAMKISEKIDVAIEYYDELREFNNGLLAGLSFEEANIQFPEPKVKRIHDKFYEQESIIEFRARAETILSKVIYEYPYDKRIAIVSHGGMINMLFRSFLKLPNDTDVSISTEDTGIHLLKIENGNRRIVFVNKIEHLSQIARGGS